MRPLLALFVTLAPAGCLVDETCLQDRDCPDGEVCLGGACLVPECDGDADCVAPKVCDYDRMCVLECEGDEQCLLGQVCERNRCVPAPDRQPLPSFEAVDVNPTTATSGETISMESLRGKVLVLYFATAT